MIVLITQVIAGIGGSERYLASLLPALNARGIDCTFLLLYEQSKTDEAKKYGELLRTSGIKLKELVIHSYLDPFLYWRIRNIVRQGNFDLVHSHLIYADFALAFTKFLFCRSMCLISTKHGYLESYVQKYGMDPHKGNRGLYWWIAAFSEQMINKSYAVSHATKKLYVVKKICRENKIEVIYHGIRSSRAPVWTPEFRYGNPQLIIVGRMQWFKGHYYALKSVASLVKLFPSLKLVVVGKGKDEVAIKKLAEDLQIYNSIEFVGFSNQVLDLMHASDVVIVPSFGETFGLVVLEAMLAGRPVVAFDVAALNEIIHHEQTGLLAKPRDVEDLSLKIRHLLDHPEDSQRLTKNAKEKTLQKFSFEKMVDNTVDFYNRVFFSIFKK